MSPLRQKNYRVFLRVSFSSTFSSLFFFSFLFLDECNTATAKTWKTIDRISLCFRVIAESEDGHDSEVSAKSRNVVSRISLPLLLRRLLLLFSPCS